MVLFSTSDGLAQPELAAIKSRQSFLSRVNDAINLSRGIRFEIHLNQRRPRRGELSWSEGRQRIRMMLNTKHWIPFWYNTKLLNPKWDYYFLAYSMWARICRELDFINGQSGSLCPIVVTLSAVKAIWDNQLSDKMTITVLHWGTESRKRRFKDSKVKHLDDSVNYSLVSVAQGES